ncbi:MAG: choice-of-anchor tandem repeat GloVer-containing protein, partial [Terriglobales bacterium]
MGTPETPASSVADGWVLIYKNATHKQLMHEVHCQNNQIQFASSRGEKNFVRKPDCTQAACTKAVEEPKITTVSLKNETGDANAFVFQGNAFAVSGLTLLYSFQGAPDGGQPEGSMIMDSSGNLYGTTYGGGTNTSICHKATDNPSYGCGTVFKLSPTASGTASETQLYAFTTKTSVAYPASGLVFDSAGNLYGTGSVSGAGYGSGIFELSPSGVETLAYGSGNIGQDALYYYTGLTPDSAGNLYAVGSSPGCVGYPCDFVVELSPAAGGAWTGQQMYAFNIANTQVYDYGAMAIDAAGDLYGTSEGGGANNHGYVFKLTNAGGTWTETTLYSFKGGTTDGCAPYGAPAVDASGNLYGTTYQCGAHSYGTVWKLTPSGTETILHSFAGGATDGSNPYAGVILDPFENLFGTTYNGFNASVACYDSGELYEISASGTYTVLHAFGTVNGGVEGCNPYDPPYLAPDGNLYGTAEWDANLGYGTVWAYKLYDPVSVTFTGTGTGAVTSNPVGLSCSTGNCSYFFTPGA